MRPLFGIFTEPFLEGGLVVNLYDDDDGFPTFQDEEREPLGLPSMPEHFVEATSKKEEVTAVDLRPNFMSHPNESYNFLLETANKLFGDRQCLDFQCTQPWMLKGTSEQLNRSDIMYQRFLTIYYWQNVNVS